MGYYEVKDIEEEEENWEIVEVENEEMEDKEEKKNGSWRRKTKWKTKSKKWKKVNEQPTEAETPRTVERSAWRSSTREQPSAIFDVTSHVTDLRRYVEIYAPRGRSSVTINIKGVRLEAERERFEWPQERDRCAIANSIIRLATIIVGATSSLDIVSLDDR